ncbi:MAG: DUF58 domain-containing protein, partial [Blastocatellia bacterium]|nr:DUF58 domain-containing protein [Blastocatellia bacterium]
QQKKSLRFILISALLTVAAIGAAMISAAATQIGKNELASLGSKAALGLALIIVVYVVPRLARSVRLEYLRSDYSIHLPNAGLVFCAVILTVAILSLSSGNNLLYLVLAILLATMLVSWIASRLCLSRLDISLRFPDHNYVDEALPFDVSINNRRLIFPAFSLAVAISEQSSPKPGRDLTELAYFPLIPAGTLARMRIERSFAKRGLYPVSGFMIGTKFPFGFIEQRRFIEAPREIAIYPQPRPLDEFPDLIPLNQGRVESRLKGNGSDLYAIRQYLSSDHHHHINWKATAKTASLMVREFTRDDDWRVTIAFDSQVAEDIIENSEFNDRFERAITLAASLIDHFISLGAEVRMLTRDLDSGFGIDRSHAYTMLRQLAPLAPERGEVGDSEAPAPQREEQLLVWIGSSLSERRPSQASSATHIISFEEL